MVHRAAVVLALVAAPALAAPQSEPDGDDAAPAEVDRMDWWRDARFGLFIHWGLYAIPAGRWGEDVHHAEWIRTTAPVPRADYDALVHRFDAPEFDPAAWAAAARDAGMGYVVITSKHHDGFCLFDSALTDYDVMSAPLRTDVCGAVADAFRAEGLRVGFYHSILDWHHDDYLPRISWEPRPEVPADFDRYVEHLRGQVTELLRNYGPIDVMWFDGEWEATWTHEHGAALYDLVRRLQPDCLVNNRVDKGRGGMAGLTVDDRYRGDFGTPEQEVPAAGLPGVDWESCVTMNEHWGYNAADDEWKSPTELVHLLADVASKGGNLLLNVGPDARGRFPAPALERLAAIGDWMDVHGDAIHGTEAGPFGHLPWGRCTRRDDDEGRSTLFLHVFDWPDDGRLVVPGLGNEPVAARLVSRDDQLLAFARDESDVVIDVPATAPDPYCPVVALDLGEAPIVYAPPRIEAPCDTFTTVLPIEIDADSDALDARYTLDGRDPGKRDPVARTTIGLTETTTVRARSFHRGHAVSTTALRTFTRVEPRPGAQPGDEVPGAWRRTWSGDWTRLPDEADLEAPAVAAVETIALPEGPAREHVLHRFDALLRVTESAVYRFALNSDDGATLAIGDEIVVDNDGLHAPLEREGTIALAPGLHPITVRWFNRTGGAELRLRWAPCGEAMREVTGDDVVRTREAD